MKRYYEFQFVEQGIKGFVIPTKSFDKMGTKNILLQQQNV